MGFHCSGKGEGRGDVFVYSAFAFGDIFLEALSDEVAVDLFGVEADCGDGFFYRGEVLLG